MKLIINSIEISEEGARAAFSIESGIRQGTDISVWDLKRQVNDIIANRLADQFISEQGAKVLSEISRDQIISAILIRSGGMLRGEK